MITAIEIREIADQFADMAEAGLLDGTESVSRVEIMEAGDGSSRALGLLYAYDTVNEHEQCYRLTLPAPNGAPAWTRNLTESTLEIRVGEGEWRDLEV